jgi:hypothetical protein
MYIHQLILHSCSNTLHLEMDFDPGGSVVATRTSSTKLLQAPPTALDIVNEGSYWSLRILRDNDWNREAVRQSLSTVARTYPKGLPQPLKRQGHLTLLNLEQVFFDPSRLECEDMELFFPQSLGYFLDSLEHATQMALATMVQADPSKKSHHDTRLIYQDGRNATWYVVFWGLTPRLEHALLPSTYPMPESPLVIAPQITSVLTRPAPLGEAVQIV